MMTDYICYWKNFWRDFGIYGPEIIIPEWHTSNEKFINQLVKGDHIWVIIQGGSDSPYEWRLLQRIYIKSIGIDHKKDKYEVQEYGHFHADGDTYRSQRFEFTDQLDLSPILLMLEFASGRKLTARGKLIGRSFQSPRALSERDAKILEDYSSRLKLVDR